MNEMERDLRDLGQRFWSDDRVLHPERGRRERTRRGRSVLPAALVGAATAVLVLAALIGGILITRSRHSMPTPAVAAPTIASLQMLTQTDGWGWSRNTVARTSDGAATFHVVTPPAVTAAWEIWTMTAIDVDHAWVVVTNASGPPTTIRLYRTVDGGATWIAAGLPAPPNWVTDGATFIDSLHGWVVIVGQTSDPPESQTVLLRTVDGGESWSTVYATTARLTVSGTPSQVGQCQFGLPSFTTPLFGIDALTDCPGGTPAIEMTQDGGVTWQRISVPRPDSPPGAAMSSSTDVPVFTSPTAGSVFSTVCVTIKPNECATYGAFFHTSDAGETWSSTTTVRIGLDLPALVDGEAWIANACIGFCPSWDGSPAVLLNTVDAGQHWTAIPIAEKLVPGGFGGSHTFAFVNSMTGYDVTSTGNLSGTPAYYRTNDGGKTWTQFTPRLIR
jgi:photosystem II stability/assembly factor-like uncharacterized protein